MSGAGNRRDPRRPQTGRAAATPGAGDPREAHRLVADLATDMGEEAAAIWVHAPAMARHAHTRGLVPEPRADAPSGEVRGAVERLAAAHPALAPLGEAVAPVMDAHPLTPAQAKAINVLWRGLPLLDDGMWGDHGDRLGGWYQDLSAPARTGRALVQTPGFVADLLVDLALVPAGDESGWERLRMIDPACGAGNILVRAWTAALGHPRTSRAPHPTPGLTRVEWAARAARAVHGVDIDPYAAAIARYRLLARAAAFLNQPITALPADWPVPVACADALLDRDAPLLRPAHYHAVVANPPYITVKDPAVRERVRAAYRQVCHGGSYPLALPFHALMMDLATPGGRVAQLTTNSFMKREFGKKYVNEFLARFDLRWLIDTSGAYLPGHGTPTVIMVHRNRPPADEPTHVIHGNRGEPSIPADPARGQVWTAIADAVHVTQFRDDLAAYAREHPPPPAGEAGG